MSGPVLDIVIPVHDRADWLELCLLAVERWTASVPHRVIVVDNGSEEVETGEFYCRAFGLAGSRSSPVKWTMSRADLGNDDDEAIPRRTLLLRGVNDSFSASVNAGVVAGGAPNVVILNSDAIVTPGWAEALLADLGDPGVGLVGARASHASGVQGSMLLQGAGLVRPAFLVFVCVALRREVWDRVGPLDAERFDGWSGEDLDYSWRVEKAGLRLLVSEGAYVFHGHSRTLAETVGDEDARARNDERYRATLMRKWGPAWVADHSRHGPNVLVASFSAEEWTRVDFMTTAIAFLAPLASQGIAWAYQHMTRMWITTARQRIVNAVRDLGREFSHVLMVDDDMAEIPSDIVSRLLRHGKPVVSVMAYGRKPPHTPCIFEVEERDAGPPRHTWLEWEHTGLRRVGATGFGLVLIEVAVFERLATHFVDGYERAGLDMSHETPADRLARRERALRLGAVMFKNEREGIGEDLFFCERCRGAGIEIWCDTDVVIGHMGSPVVVNEAFRKKWKADDADRRTPDRRGGGRAR